MDPSLITAARAHLRQLGVATPRSLARAVTGGDHALAQRLANALVKHRSAERRQHRNLHGRWEYLVDRERVGDARSLRASVAVLEFAWRGNSTLLDDAARRSLASVADRVRIDLDSAPPCYLFRADARSAVVLSAIHVPPVVPLQQVVAHLDDWVSAPAFALWRPFALSSGFLLTVLHAGTPESARELGRWLRRRPPVSRSGANAIPVPSRVFFAPSAA